MTDPSEPTDSPGTAAWAPLVVVGAPSVAVAAVAVLADPPGWATAALVLVAAAVSAALTRTLVERPLRATVANHRAGWTRAELALQVERAERDLRARVERTLRGTDTEGAALRVGMRAVAEAIPDAEVELLLSLPDEPRIGWRVRLGAGELHDAVSVTGSPTCAALADGATVLSSPRSLEACAHLAGTEDDVSTTCIPLRVEDRAIGVVCVTTAPGEKLDARSLELAEWIVDAMGRCTARHRESAAAAGGGQPCDPLTGLPTAAALRPHLRNLVRSLTPFCTAVIEIDRFDRIDSDAEADSALVTVAGVLCDVLRPGDLICRFDDGAFAAVLPACDADQAVAAMERAREGLALTLAAEALALEASSDDPLGEPLGPADFGLTCSVGVVESRHATSLDEIVELATSACDAAASAGGNRVALADRTLGHA